MARNKKTTSHDMERNGTQGKERTTASTGSMQSTSSGCANSKATGTAQQQHGQSTVQGQSTVSTLGRTTRRTPCQEAISIQHKTDTPAQHRGMHSEGTAMLVNRRQQKQLQTWPKQQRWQKQPRGAQAHTSIASSATDSNHSVEKPATEYEASELVSQLRCGIVSEQVQLLGLTKDLSYQNGARSALQAAGIVPVLLHLLQARGKRVRRKVFDIMMVHMECLTARRQEASLKSIIPQLVSLVRSHNQDTQHNALQWLCMIASSSSSSIGSNLAPTMVAAGAVPAVTEALHKGLQLARLCAADLLLKLSGASGMGIDTALAGAVPVAVSILQCGTPDVQWKAVYALTSWTCQFRQASVMAVSADGIPALLGFLCSQRHSRWVTAAQLLSDWVCHGGGAQAAIEGGAVPIVVHLLQSGFKEQYAVFHAAHALLGMMSDCSQAASMAAAAGAIPPLIRILARTVSNRQQPGHSHGSGNQRHRATSHISDNERRHLAAVAICCLSSIARRGDWQCRSAMVASGATAAISAALHIRHQDIRLLARSTFQYLLADHCSRPQVAVHLIALLRNGKARITQEHAMCAILLPIQEARFRSTMVAAGALPALLAVLSDSKASESIAKRAVYALSTIATDAEHADAIVKAGAVPILAQLMQHSPVEYIRKAAVVAFGYLAKAGDSHDQLIDGMLQLMNATNSDSAQARLFASQGLQLLAAAGITMESVVWKKHGSRGVHRTQAWVANSCIGKLVVGASGKGLQPVQHGSIEQQDCMAAAAHC